MKPAAQALHVLRKDLVESRWLLVAYGALVVVATGHAMRWPLFAGGVFGLTEIAIGLVALIVIAIAVQSDSPSRADAFWASRPFHPLAIVGAKALLAVLLIAIAAATQVVAVHSYDVHGARLAALVASPATYYALLLVAAIIAAALTTDVRGFLLALVLVPVGIVLANQLLQPSSWMPHGGAESCMFAALVLAAVLVVLPYVRRDILRLARSLAVLAMLLFSLSIGQASSPFARPDTIPTSTSTPDSGFVIRAFESREADEVGISLDPPTLSPGELMELRDGMIVARLRDGRTLRLQSSGNGAEYSGNGIVSRWTDLGELPPLVSRSSIASAAGYRGRVRIGLTAHLTDEQRRAVQSGIVELSLEGRVVVLAAHERWRMPLHATGDWVHGGRRVHLDSVSTTVPAFRLTMHTSALGESASVRLFGRDEERFEIVSADSMRVIPLQRQDGGGGIDGLVIPYSTASTTKYAFRGDRYLSSEAGEGDSWLTNATLMAYDYQPVRSFPLRLSLAGDALIPKRSSDRIQISPRPPGQGSVVSVGLTPR